MFSAAAVSIPQSGFGAFEPIDPKGTAFRDLAVSILSRDSGRLNWGVEVFFAHRLDGFNPSVGIRGV